MKDFNSFMDEHPYDTTPTQDTQDTSLFNINEYMIGIDVSPSGTSVVGTIQRLSDEIVDDLITEYAIGFDFYSEGFIGDIGEKFKKFIKWVIDTIKGWATKIKERHASKIYKKIIDALDDPNQRECLSKQYTKDWNHDLLIKHQTMVSKTAHKLMKIISSEGVVDSNLKKIAPEIRKDLEVLKQLEAELKASENKEYGDKITMLQAYERLNEYYVCEKEVVADIMALIAGSKALNEIVEMYDKLPPEKRNHLIEEYTKLTTEALQVLNVSISYMMPSNLIKKHRAAYTAATADAKKQLRADFDDSVHKESFSLKSADDFIFESANETGDSIIYAGEIEETSEDTVTESFAKLGKSLTELYNRAWFFTALTLPTIVDVSTVIAAATLTVNSIVTSTTFNKKYKTFPEDVKKVNDMIIAAKNGKGSEDPKEFIKAVYKLGNTCKTLNAKKAFSNKAVRAFTSQEHTELDNLRKICEDIVVNFSKKPEKNAERRMAARLEDFLECSTKLLNMMKRGSETNVNEFMV